MPVLTQFDDPKLMAVAETFCANPRNIKQHASWWITRSFVDGDGERLLATADAFGGHLHVALWEDGAIMFRMAMGFSEDQFDWDLRFVGDHLQLSPSDILERFVSSITCRRSDLIGLWKSVTPVVEYSRSRV